MYSYFGSCPNAKESLILFEAARRGLIPTASNRLSEDERKSIVSGAIYIWDENKNPVRRWTDGKKWSNSRVVGGFLEYRELMVETPATKPRKYTIKPHGLRKRTIFLPTDDGSSLRLIAYFNYQDIRKSKLSPPSQDSAFKDIVQSIDGDTNLQKTLVLLSTGKRRKASIGSVPPTEPEKERLEDNSLQLPPIFPNSMDYHNITLPSPIWIPEVRRLMNSEDQRALQLLDATPGRHGNNASKNNIPGHKKWGRDERAPASDQDLAS